MTKIILILAFVSNGHYNKGVAHTREYQMSSVEHCEMVSKHLQDIYAVDDAMRYVLVSTQCVEI